MISAQNSIHLGRRLIKGAFQVVIGILLVFLTAELALRIVYLVRNRRVDYMPLPYAVHGEYGPIPPWVDGLRILQPDAKLVWTLKPNLHRKYIDIFSPVSDEEERTELVRKFSPVIPAIFRNNPAWEISVNSMGFRDIPFTSKRPGTFRIICIGDSWTFGANVGQDQAYPQRLRSLLHREFPGANLEVFNMGVPGYSSYQGLLLLKTKALEMQPDVVVIGFGMNDAIPAGYRDKELQTKYANVNRLRNLLNTVEIYKLFQYRQAISQYKSMSMTRHMKRMAAIGGTPKEAWVGKEGTELADYKQLEPYLRVSPSDYEKNVTEMVELAKNRGATAILLYNQLWSSPYSTALERISVAERVPFVNSKALIDRARTDIEEQLQNRLNLRPAASDDHSQFADKIPVVFRVYSGSRIVPKALYITGTDHTLGNAVPNEIKMYDDGTHGDQRAGDHVWSYTAPLTPDQKIYYVYTNSGRPGHWEGLDIPEVRRFVVKRDGTGTLYRPIETFGELYMQADGWHTNALGYDLIARALLEALKQDSRTQVAFEAVKHRP